ncbi:MAG: hypothetical protein BEN18_10055 [Epulopiscium sp. Nuni2H_MBin001]|nr:MAG: hypothetical protein BEN18_10055 [Epulopiscium sp. Nuni2H_MBin001]
MWITKLALKRQVSVALLIVLMIIFGITSVMGLKMSYMPSLNSPMYYIVTIYPGASADVIEKEITDLISEAGETISGFTQSVTTSLESVSQVRLDFDYGIDLNQTYIDLKAAIDRLEFPADAQQPLILQVSSVGSSIMEISVRSTSQADELVFVTDILEPKISTILGVGDTEIFGGIEQHVEILLDEPAMELYGLNSFMVANAVSNANYTLPLGGVNQGNQTLQLLASASAETMYDLQNIPITTLTGMTVLLKDVASVDFVAKEVETISRFNTNENVGLSIQSTQDANVPQVTNQIMEAVVELRQLYSDMDIQIVSNTTDGIYESLSSVATTLIIAIALCMFVLLMFLGDYKASLIVASSIPTSLLITVIGIGASDFELNLIISCGLVIAIGLMVDNSIVILESIFKTKTDDNSFYDAAVEGVKSVGSSVGASTLTTVVVYVPLVFLSGLSGELFSELGFSIIYALVSSLLVAVTIVPLVYYKLQPIEKTTAPLNKVMVWLERAYEKVVRKVLHAKFLAVLVAVGSLVLTGYIVTLIPIEIIPLVDEGIIDMEIEFRPGTDIMYISEAVVQVENQLASDNRIENFSVTIESNVASVAIYVDEKYNTWDIANDYELMYRYMPDMDSVISVRDISGVNTDMPSSTISVYGVDYDSVLEQAARLTNEMYNIAGVIKVTSSMGAPVTQAKLNIDPLQTAFYGLSVSDISQLIYCMNNGIDAGTIEVHGTDYDIVINYPEGLYDDFNKLMSMTISTPKGLIAISDVAHITFEDTIQSIQRVTGNYYVDLKAFTLKEHLPYVEQQVQILRDNMPQSALVAVTEQIIEDPLGGEMGAIIQAVAIGIFLVFVVMAMQFESIRFSLMVMASIVFSFIGSFGLLYLSGLDLSLVALVGLLMLAGIVVNNGILFVDTTNQLKEQMPLEDALVKSGTMRMRPILMTTATTVLSMVPLALGIGKGSQLLQSMGVIIIGGLLTSTVLVLLLMPTFYLIISKNN